MRAVTFGALVTLACSLLATEVAAQETIVVLPAKILHSASGLVDPELVEDGILTALQANSHFRVVGRSDLDSVFDLERQRDLLGCDDNTCFSEIGGALDAEYLLDVKLGRTVDRWQLAAKLIRLTGGEPTVEGRLLEALPGGVDELLTALPASLRRLLGQSGLTLCRDCGSRPRVLIWLVDLNPDGAIEARTVEAGIIDTWSAHGFSFVDLNELTRPSSRAEVKAATLRHGAEIVIGVVGVSSDIGAIMGTQMHSLRAGVSLRAFWAHNGEILATADQTTTVGHLDTRLGRVKALRKASVRAAETLLAKMLDGS